MECPRKDRRAGAYFILRQYLVSQFAFLEATAYCFRFYSPFYFEEENALHVGVNSLTP